MGVTNVAGFRRGGVHSEIEGGKKREFHTEYTEYTEITESEE
jgi:hypothetical protein